MNEYLVKIIETTVYYRRVRGTDGDNAQETAREAHFKNPEDSQVSTTEDGIDTEIVRVNKGVN